MSTKEEYFYYTKDEDGVALAIQSNHGKDKGKYLEHARGSKRPVLVQIESDLFTSYKFTNFALTVEEAKMLSKELMRMVDYLEE